MPQNNIEVLGIAGDIILDVFSSLLNQSSSNPLLTGGLISIGTIIALSYFVKNLNN